jgi:hypothetical protein
LALNLLLSVSKDSEKQKININGKNKMMNTKLACLLIIMVLAGLSIMGCSRDDLTNARFTDDDFLRGQGVQVDSVSEFDDSEELALDDGSDQIFDYNDYGFMKPTDLITPLRWGRKIESKNRTVVVNYLSDTIAVATIIKTINGTFIVKGIKGTDTIKVQKPFSAISTRKIRFKRIDTNRDPRKNWIPVAMSLTLGTTTGLSSSPNFGISELEITTPVDTADVTNPLTYWLRMAPWKGGVVILHPGDSIKVRLTLTSPNDSAEYAVLRHGTFNKINKRIRQLMPLISQTGTQGNYTRIYEKKYVSHLPLGYAFGRFNAIVDIMSYDSINNDAAPFMNLFWSMPYIVKRWQ